MQIETIELLDNGIIKLDESYLELKMIGAILVTPNSDSVRIELKNSKTLNLTMSKEYSANLSKFWLQEADRRKSEAIRCSKPKLDKTLNNIAEQVADEIERRAHASEQAVLKMANDWSNRTQETEDKKLDEKERCRLSANEAVVAFKKCNKAKAHDSWLNSYLSQKMKENY